MNRDKVLTACTALVGVAAVVASFSTLAALAVFVGWGDRSAWLLPVCIDALALGAGRVWLSNRYDSEARRFARAASMAALAVSVAGNAVGHIVALDNAPWWKVALAVLVGAVPPVALAAVGHLMTLSARPQDEAKPSPAPVPAPVASPAPAPVVSPAPVPVPSPARVPVPSAGPAPVPVASPAPVPVPPASPAPVPVRRPTPVPASTMPEDSTGKDKARALWDDAPEGKKPSGAALARHAGVDASLGRRWRREWETELVPA
ncbi:DUF2637 domain-containing protein [Kribbella deserti]|uniref:DUF2637 domain-containing protein n=1 Tax=Kribbella deserti TaxID=1926257 RepID=A0ABV6QJ78_9ACTN